MSFYSNFSLFWACQAFNNDNTKNSAMILNTIREGKIVPSEVTVKLIRREMESSDNHKFLIDGFPRSEENRAAFEQIVSLARPCP